MKGPRAGTLQPSPARKPPTSSVQIAFLESIKFYQKWVSPIGGDRCGFRPSCSRYGYTAITTQGPVVGLMMTGDRLIRCNIWKSPGPDYFLLPNGRLYDPLSNNLFVDK
ncbi:MAG: membrane protein insertion efficiency factor YidD [Deltaproteobacteria bacterium]|nr:membrane protein insertion efficiency factor YidD [Deltaproteobacteria bacterium]